MTESVTVSKHYVTRYTCIMKNDRLSKFLKFLIIIRGCLYYKRTKPFLTLRNEPFKTNWAKMSLSQNGKICTEEGLTLSQSQPHHHHRHQWITWLIHIHIHHCTSTDNKGCFCPAGQNTTKVCGEAEKSTNKVANHSPWRSLLWDQTAATEAHRVN